jgi:VanZ family protein
MRRWLVLAGYTALLYGMLPYGPILGRAVLGSGVGRVLLGGGAVAVVVAGIIASTLRLRRRRAPVGAWVLLAVTAIGYALALSWLRTIRLERLHLPEYGVAGWLAWRALAPSLGTGVRTYLLAAILAAAIGWGDELVQAVTPGRYYDLRDVVANAIGAGLGVMVVAVWRAGSPRVTR